MIGFLFASKTLTVARFILPCTTIAEPQRGRVLPPRHAPAGLPRSYNPVGCMVLQVFAGSSCWARRAAAGASRTGGTSAFTAR